MYVQLNYMHIGMYMNLDCISKLLRQCTAAAIEFADINYPTFRN